MDEGRELMSLWTATRSKKEAEGDLEMLIEGAEHMAVDDSEGAAMTEIDAPWWG